MSNEKFLINKSKLPETADANLVLIRNDNDIVGRCSLWWKNTPPYPNHHLGLIGHYTVEDAAAADRILQHACEQLAAFGCTMVVAPVDGNTWQSYRLLTERGEQPTFFLEPDHPDDWHCHFLDRGFTTLAHYTSALNTNLSYVEPRLKKVAARLEDAGVQIRSLNLQRIEDELHRIYTVAIASFQGNFLYTHLKEDEFTAQYLPLLRYLKSELILIAEHDGNPVGFLFAIPDWLQAQRGENINTIIIKTVAILPKRIYAGLGNLLVAKCQAIAHQLGYSRAIHALMHDANPSRNLSRRYAQTIRGYTLFAKQLI
ncbi:GNAT family N-acetyltransferase [Aerosakkonema funiforme]|uniref:GNAT family N-acetyltransferase n=1 Tax=Aerosakkonema funiforme TaxID=1246630 RepID=UPI0035B82EED